MCECICECVSVFVDGCESVLVDGCESVFVDRCKYLWMCGFVEACLWI